MAAEEIGLINFEHDQNFPATLGSNSSPYEQILVWDWYPIPWHWWQVLQLMLAILGILGNLLVVIVLFRPGHRRSSTDTLIAGLAVADFITSVAIIPHSQAKNAPSTLAGHAYCRIIHISYFVWLSTYASCLTLMTISIERYLAVVHPFLFQRIFKPRLTSAILTIIWLFSFILNSYHFYIMSLTNGECVVQFPSGAFQSFLGVTIFFCSYFFIPVFIMICANVSTINRLQDQAGNTITRASWMRGHYRCSKFVRVRRRIIRVLFVVIVFFVVCWTPDQLFFLLYNLRVIDSSYLFSEVYRIFVLLAFVHTFANFIIYAAMNRKFRQAVREMYMDIWTYLHSLLTISMIRD